MKSPFKVSLKVLNTKIWYLNIKNVLNVFEWTGNVPGMDLDLRLKVLISVSYLGKVSWQQIPNSPENSPEVSRQGCKRSVFPGIVMGSLNHLLYG